MMVEGAVDARGFRVYVELVLSSTLRTGDSLVMDNLFTRTERKSAAVNE